MKFFVRINKKKINNKNEKMRKLFTRFFQEFFQQQQFDLDHVIQIFQVQENVQLFPYISLFQAVIIQILRPMFSIAIKMRRSCA